MKRLISICLLGTILSISSISAQDKANIEHTIASAVFNKERTVRVFLPSRYLNDSTATFPVVYVLDAQSDRFWNIAKGNIGYLSDNYAIIPTIVVGIVSDNRGEEFSPPATDLQNHFKNEVFPLIEANYRTDGFRAVIGHSWGGNFVGTTLFSENKELFNAYIGISPSFGDTDNLVVKNAASMLKNKDEFKKYLYFSHGDVGRRELEFKGYVNSIDSLIKRYPNTSLAWQPRLIERVDHWQIVGPSICDAMISMSRNYFADQKVMEGLAKRSDGDLKSQIKAFNKKQKSTFGYIHEPTSGYLNFVANDFRDMDDYDTAIAIYNMALEKSPDDVKVYVNICDVYDKTGNKKAAKPAFQKTLNLLEAQKEKVGERYYTNVKKWLNEKLESYD